MAGKPILRKAAHGNEKSVWTLRVSVILANGERSQPAITFRGSEREAKKALGKFETMTCTGSCYPFRS